MNEHDIAEQAYKNGYEKGYRDGKDSAMESIMFPKFLIRQPEPSKEELEALMNSPVIIHKSREEIIPLYHNGWIPVTERLPKYFDHVLINVPGDKPFTTVHEAHLRKDNLWDTGLYRYDPEDVTHWMPLPEPPKGD